MYDSTTEAARRRQVDSLKRDIARMNAVLNQMQNNLGMVSTLQDPLKHQFQLEIEMWRIQLDHMNQDLLRLQGLDSAPSSPSQP